MVKFKPNQTEIESNWFEKNNYTVYKSNSINPIIFIKSIPVNQIDFYLNQISFIWKNNSEPIYFLEPI